MVWLLAILWCASSGLPAAARVNPGPAGAGRPHPRAILALYDSHATPDTWRTNTHRMAEMPLNYLGFIVRYHDIQRGLPHPASLEDVRGVLSWFEGDSIPDPEGYVSWLEQLAREGKRFVCIGEPAMRRSSLGRPTAQPVVDRFWKVMGLRSLGGWSSVTYDSLILFQDPSMTGFERPYGGVLPPFELIVRDDPAVRVHLELRRGRPPHARTAHLVTTGPGGGYAAAGYTHYQGQDPFRQWHLNPFEFFNAAFGAAGAPRLDATTLAGRRMYYSHIDGDGWRNKTEIYPYRTRAALSAEVILDEVLKRFPDMPVTVAPIAADLDPRLLGSEQALAAARAIFALPHVEAGTHTYSHPLQWEFFAAYDPAEERRRIGRRDNPRSYWNVGFDLRQEIAGSAAFINTLLPQGKRVALLQWSGNTRAFGAAIEEARKAGLRNINGGDTRFDADFPSVMWVAPVGRQVGREFQVYSSASNENTYTDLWTQHFFGYRYLGQTIDRTESPRRLKPVNLYYHMYSGEKLPALRAVLENLERVRSSEVIPVTAAFFAGVADGFWRARIREVGPGQWAIANREELQTVRFDQAAGRSVDFGRSRGVIGQRMHQGSLYVALDASEPEPVVALRAGHSGRAEASPWLVHSRWRVWRVTAAAEEVRFLASGFGAGEMVWRMPSPGRYRIWRRGQATDAEAGVDGLLRFTLRAPGIEPAEVSIVRQ